MSDIMAPKTMQELLQAFTEHIRSVLAASSVRQKQYALKGFLAWVEDGHKPLAALTLADIEEYAVTKAHCAASTRREYLMAIRDFYEFLRTSRPEQFPLGNPTQGITFKRYKQRRVMLVPGPEAIREALVRLKAREDTLSMRNSAMAELSYGSGLRLGELVALDVEDIDFEKAQAYIRGKGGRTRMAPITTAALAALRAYLDRRAASEGPLFVGRRGPRLHPVSVGWLFRKKVGIRSHMLRHACATHMLLNGCDVRLIQEILGHKYLTTTQVYTHIIPVDVERIVKRLHPRASTN
jgi:integrase/recombinase XerC